MSVLSHLGFETQLRSDDLQIPSLAKSKLKKETQIEKNEKNVSI